MTDDTVRSDVINPTIALKTGDVTTQPDTIDVENESASLPTPVDADNESAPLAGLLSSKPGLRKNAYYGYAGASLVLSCGSDLVLYGIVTGAAITPLTASIAFATSALVKIGIAFGFVAASNVSKK